MTHWFMPHSTGARAVHWLRINLGFLQHFCRVQVRQEGYLMQLRTSASTLEANINVTPLVDVCLVLLIIFMVVMPVMITGVPVHLPKTHTASDLGKGEQLKITVNADGTVFLNGLARRAEEVPSEVQRLHAVNPAMNVAVRGDKAVKYGEGVKVLDACRAPGFQDFGPVSDREPWPGPWPRPAMS